MLRRRSKTPQIPEFIPQTAEPIDDNPLLFRLYGYTITHVVEGTNGKESWRVDNRTFSSKAQAEAWVNIQYQDSRQLEDGSSYSTE